MSNLVKAFGLTAFKQRKDGRGQGRMNTFIDRFFSSSSLLYIYTTRERNEHTSFGQCIDPSLFAV